MSSQYIIKFCKNIETLDPIVDGFVELKKTQTGHNTIEVRTKKDSNDENNIVLLHKIITSNFAKVSYDDISMECFIEFKKTSTSTDYCSIIYFDKSSSSAYSEFKKNFTEMTNTQIETIYYANGHVWYVGEVLQLKEADKLVDRVGHGQGTLFYDGNRAQPKYKGEFENGKYDGSGIFYSYDGKISISSNNISNGIPTQKGKLSINFNKFLNELIEVDFTEVFDKLCPSKTKEFKQIFVRSDSFVKKVTEMYWNNNEPIDKTIFREKSVEDKHVDIWNQIQELSTKVEQLGQQNKQINETYQNEIRKLIGFATCAIIFSQTLLFILC